MVTSEVVATLIPLKQDSKICADGSFKKVSNFVCEFFVEYDTAVWQPHKLCIFQFDSSK
jgi:hypothetical protein